MKAVVGMIIVNLVLSVRSKQQNLDKFVDELKTEFEANANTLVLRDDNEQTKVKRSENEIPVPKVDNLMENDLMAVASTPQIIDPTSLRKKRSHVIEQNDDGRSTDLMLAPINNERIEELTANINTVESAYANPDSKSLRKKRSHAIMKKNNDEPADLMLAPIANEKSNELTAHATPITKVKRNTERMTKNSHIENTKGELNSIFTQIHAAKRNKLTRSDIRNLAKKALILATLQKVKSKVAAKQKITPSKAIKTEVHKTKTEKKGTAKKANTKKATNSQKTKKSKVKNKKNSKTNVKNRTHKEELRNIHSHANSEMSNTLKNIAKKKKKKQKVETNEDTMGKGIELNDADTSSLQGIATGKHENMGKQVVSASGEDAIKGDSVGMMLSNSKPPSANKSEFSEDFNLNKGSHSDFGDQSMMDLVSNKKSDTSDTNAIKIEAPSIAAKDNSEPTAATENSEPASATGNQPTMAENQPTKTENEPPSDTFNPSETEESLTKYNPAPTKINDPSAATATTEDLKISAETPASAIKVSTSEDADSITTMSNNDTSVTTTTVGPSGSTTTTTSTTKKKSKLQEAKKSKIEKPKIVNEDDILSSVYTIKTKDIPKSNIENNENQIKLQENNEAVMKNNTQTSAQTKSEIEKPGSKSTLEKSMSLEDYVDLGEVQNVKKDKVPTGNIEEKIDSLKSVLAKANNNKVPKRFLAELPVGIRMIAWKELIQKKRNELTKLEAADNTRMSIAEKPVTIDIDISQDKIDSQMAALVQPTSPLAKDKKESIENRIESASSNIDSEIDSINDNTIKEGNDASKTSKVSNKVTEVHDKAADEKSSSVSLKKEPDTSDSNNDDKVEKHHVRYLKKHLKGARSLRKLIAKTLIGHCKSTGKRILEAFVAMDKALARAQAIADVIGRKFHVNSDSIDNLVGEKEDEVVETFLRDIFTKLNK